VGVLVMMPLVMIVSGCHHGYDVSTPAQPLQHLCVCLWGAFWCARMPGGPGGDCGTKEQSRQHPKHFPA